MEKVTFFGHVVSKEGILVEPEKMEAITQWHKPKNATEVRSFLRIAGYYCKFVQNFSRIAAPHKLDKEDHDV